MTTGVLGTTARQYPQQMIHYLRKDFTFSDAGKVLTVGTIPAGSILLKQVSGVVVNVAFDSGTNKQIDIGSTANDDLYGTDMSLGTIGFVAIDEAVSALVAADTTITATPDLTGTAATAGSGSVVIGYIPNNG